MPKTTNNKRQSSLKLDSPKPDIKALRAAITTTRKATKTVESLESSKEELTQEMNAASSRSGVDTYLKAKAKLELLPRDQELAEEALETAEDDLRAKLDAAKEYISEFAYAVAERLKNKIAGSLRKYCRHCDEAESLANQTHAVQTLYKAPLDLFEGDDLAEIGERVINFLSDPSSFEVRIEYAG